MSERIMKACDQCQGDGALRVPRSETNPLWNVSGMLLIDGHWTGKCRTCSGRGIYEWTRGKSLTPIYRGVPS